MSQYNLNRQLIQDAVVDDISNVIALRSDIHTTFDHRRFVIVRKKGQWVVHFTDLTNDLGRLYHNTLLGLHQDVSSKCLLVRFARAIFPSVMKFLDRGGPSCTGTEEARKTFATSRGRSISPKKRKGNAGTDEPGDASARPLDRSKRRRTVPAAPLSNVSCSTTASCPPSRNRPCPQTPPETLDKPLPTDLPDNNDNFRSNSHRSRAQDLPYLKRLWLLRQRPSDPSLYCCDYNAAEAAAKAGVLGKREWGGSHLCEECLGVEYCDESDHDSAAE
ncbi:hypothetical protein LTR28_006229 [Elasticomyces elasticus]|nr:hypothetical protein LTR28_006229 [Elasticomyces elasticus]